jgi:uncharacterized protein
MGREKTLLTRDWQPLTQTERYRALDAIRGASLFGVLLVNLLTLFRVSLFQHILTFHTHPGWANHLVDDLVSGLVEFKAFTLFSLMFGVGVAIQTERAMTRGVKLNRFLVRRFLMLLALGLCHLLLIWNGDILVLYAVCGLLLIPVLRLPARALAALGAAFIVLPFFVPLGIALPGREVLRAHAAEATRVYSQGGFLEILTFRWAETRRLILPLLLGSLPRTAGLMLWGLSAWRSGVLREPERHRGLLRAIFLGAGLTGGITAALQVYSQSYGVTLEVPFPDLTSNIPLALAYGAGLLLWLSRAPASALVAQLAAAGQMALTNYLTESIVLGVIFYGYGFGLFGRLGPVGGALIGIALYIGQLAFSRMWLGRYRFGPFEWLWRSMTYGRRQPMRHAAPTPLA